MQFEWDTVKAAKNLRDHKVSFENAQAIFFDENRLIFADDREDYGEDRFIVLGIIEDRIHVVVFTERNEAVRIISARKANAREQKRYADSQTRN